MCWERWIEQETLAQRVKPEPVSELAAEKRRMRPLGSGEASDQDSAAWWSELDSGVPADTERVVTTTR